MLFLYHFLSLYSESWCYRRCDPHSTAGTLSSTGHTNNTIQDVGVHPVCFDAENPYHFFGTL